MQFRIHEIDLTTDQLLFIVKDNLIDHTGPLTIAKIEMVFSFMPRS